MKKILTVLAISFSALMTSSLTTAGPPHDQDRGYDHPRNFNSDKKQNLEVKGKVEDIKEFVLDKNIDEIYCSLNEISNEKLKELVEFVVASRIGFKSKKANEFKSLDINIDISSTQLRNSMNLAYIPIEIKDDILNLKREGKVFEY